MKKYTFIYQDDGSFIICYGIYDSLKKALSAARKKVLYEIEQWSKNDYTISKVCMEYPLEGDTGYGYSFHISHPTQEHNENFYVLECSENEPTE